MNKNAIIGIVVGGIVVVVTIIIIVVVVLRSEIKVRIYNYKLQWSTDNKNWQNAKVPTSTKKIISVQKEQTGWAAQGINYNGMVNLISKHTVLSIF